MNELQTFEYEHDGVHLVGQLARPAGDGPHPAVLVMHDAHGLGPAVRRRALDLADAGYVALATDAYGDGIYFTDPLESGPIVGALLQDPERLRGRLLAGLNALRALPQVDADRIGAIGFCFGGRCVLELARSGAAVRAVVSFHGLLKTDLPAQPDTVQARIMVLTGGLDPFAPSEDVDGFRNEMARAGVDYHLTIYSDGWHAFTDPDADKEGKIPGVRYDPLLDQLSWAQATSFLSAVVRG